MSGLKLWTTDLCQINGRCGRTVCHLLQRDVDRGPAAAGEMLPSWSTSNKDCLLSILRQIVTVSQ